MQLTSVDLLVDGTLDRALVGLCHSLGLDTVAEQRSRVHGTLKGISSPAEQVISVGTIALAIIIAPHERLRAVGGPKRLVVEHGRVPHGLKGDLRHPYRVRGRASTGGNKSSPAGVVHMILVIGTVQVLAVPARWEVMDRHDPRSAWGLWELGSFRETGHNIT